MNKFVKITVLPKIRRLSIAAFVAAVLATTLSQDPARADTQETCTVNSVVIQPPVTGIPETLMLIGCTDNTGYLVYVGTPAAGSCYVNSDTLKSMEAIALTARVTGNPLTIFWNQVSCPGNSAARIIDYIQM
jgi:hypothetical protein